MVLTYGVVFTYNNYSQEDLLKLRGAVGQRGISYICWGREVGEAGTPHLQGYLQSSMKNFSRLMQATGQCAMAAAKAASGPSEQELAGVFGEPYTAIGYCMKDGDFEEYGEKLELAAVKKGQRSDLLDLKSSIDAGMDYDTICETHFATAAKYHKFIKERVQAGMSVKVKADLLKSYDGVVWRPWQEQLIASLNGAPDRRKIQWYWEPTGKVGKSFLGMFLAVSGKACLLEMGKKPDLAHAISKDQDKDTVVFDLTRKNEEHMAGLYSLAEALKNGMMFSGKYDSGPLFFATKHVIFFANFKPDMTAWSADRYHVVEI